MTLDEFVVQNTGKPLDYDGYYGAQCVDLIEYYIRDVYGQPAFYANAKDWFYNFGGSLAQRFDRITNNPTDYNQVPSRGDIIIWDGALAGSGGYGHIAIYLGKTGAGIFTSFDQNWGGMYCHQVSHNYNNVVGWLKPKASAPPTGGSSSIMDNDDKIKRQYITLRGNEGTPAERAGWLNKPYDQFNITATPEINSREQAKRDTQAHIDSLTSINNQLNEQLTIANNTVGTTKAERDAALTQATDLQSQLTEAMDKLKEAQDVPPTTSLPDEKTVVVGWLKRLWDSLFNKKGQ